MIEKIKEQAKEGKWYACISCSMLSRVCDLSHIAICVFLYLSKEVKMEDNSEILKTGVVKSKVAKGLKMSIQSVTKALQELVDAKIIKEVVSEYGYTHYEIEIIHAERGSDLEGFEVLFFDPSEYWYHRNNDIRDRINNLVDAYNEWENRSKDKQK